LSLEICQSATYTVVAEMTKNPAVARIADRTGCHWRCRSSKVNHFHLI